MLKLSHMVEFRIFRPNISQLFFNLFFQVQRVGSRDGSREYGALAMRSVRDRLYGIPKWYLRGDLPLFDMLDDPSFFSLRGE
jgi:hypothetical protein